MFDAEDILMSLKISTQQDSIYCALVKKILPEKNPDHKLTVIPINRKITYPYFQQSESDILPSSELLLQYMDEIIDSTNARKEFKANIKSKYHTLLEEPSFPLIETDKFITIEQFLTEYLPTRIACIFCYAIKYESYDKESFDYISDYVEQEYQKIKPDISQYKTYAELIVFLSNQSIDENILDVCQKASAQMKIDKERMKVDFQYITSVVYKSMYDTAKNHFDAEIRLPQYSKEQFENDTKNLIPDGFFADTKPARPNTLCKKLRESDLAYVEKMLRAMHSITFSKLSEELEEKINVAKPEDESTVKETIMNRINILMQFVGYNGREIPISMKNVFSEAYQLFSKDFLLGIKKYNEQGCIDYQADPDNNEILEIICKDTEARAVWLLCKVMKTICLITSESKKEYYKQLQSMHFNDKHLRAIYCYYKELNA